VTVVFPFVPVTPTVRNRPAGSPKNAAETGPIASRTAPTHICVASRGSQRSTRSAVAPRATASPARSCPSTLLPGTQKKSEPGAASSERQVTSETLVEASPRSS
jgi:hypothetical protein